jgi:predicted AlkP superfamily phosphohydrolase/phosphomutase
MSSKKENEKVLVIGLDGATPDLLFKWAKEGRLPTFAKLIDNGVTGALESTVPPRTCPAWLSFKTGKNPGKLGAFDFFDRKPGTYEIRYGANFQSIDSNSVWDILGERGKKVGILNVPFTFPPREVNGFIVSGWPIPQGAIFTYPNNLQSEIDIRAGKRQGIDRTIHMATWRWFSDEDEFLEGLYQFTEWETKATKHLMSKYNWDFFVTIFSGTDVIQHFFWKHTDPKHPLYEPKKAEKYGNEILKYYQKIDGIIEELLKDIDDNTWIIIMSDHGFGPFYDIFNINEWLKEKGFLEIRERSHNFLSRLMRKIFQARKRTFDLVVSFAHGLGMLGIYYFITDNSTILRALITRARGLLEGSTFKQSMGSTYPSLEEIGVDWSKTKAYSFGTGGTGNIYINLVGREPQGIVKSGKEYREVRDRLIEELKNFAASYPNRKIDIEIFKKEEIYHGKYLDQAPDVLILMNKGETRIDCSFGHGGLFTHDLTIVRDNAIHRMEGILLVKGPGIKKGVRMDQARIIDIAPTILYMMGSPIPSDMDGKVLTSAFATSYLKSKPVMHEKVTRKPRARGPKYEWSGEDKEALKKRLKSLGYI